MQDPGIFIAGPNGESSVFPIIGRMDYRSIRALLHKSPYVPASGCQ